MKWTTFLPLILSVGTLLSFEHVLHTASHAPRSSDQHALQAVWTACFSYANAHEGKFPDGKSSNEAFRQLFIAGLVDDEKLFQGRGTNKVIQDGNIGTQENGFLQALAPGECAYSYIRGRDTDEQSLRAPLIIAQVINTDGNPWVIFVRCGGTVESYSSINGTALEKWNGNQADRIFEEYLKEYYGILPQDILKPEGPHRDITALAHQRKMEILRIEAAIILLIWLPFLIPLWIKHRRKPKPHPETPTPQA